MLLYHRSQLIKMCKESGIKYLKQRGTLDKRTSNRRQTTKKPTAEAPKQQISVKTREQNYK